LEDFYHFYFLLEFGLRHSRIQDGKKCLLRAISLIEEVKKYNTAGSDEMKMQLR
jgi:hypothetical protein